MLTATALTIGSAALLSAATSAQVRAAASGPAPACEAQLVSQPEVANSLIFGFGEEIQIEDDLLVVNDPEWAESPDEPSTGRVYLYRRDEQSGEWSFAQALLPDGPAPEPFDAYGLGVAIESGRVFVGYARAPAGDILGSVLVFEEDPVSGQFVEVDRISAQTGDAYEIFGSSCDADGDRLIVGARSGESGGNNTGVAYVFARQTSGAWVQEARLEPPPGVGRVDAGESVSI